ncbi:hypothetical protein MRB53_013230 [Persea americana]|uniref:Uncharacterized protein n=1 Tax=Persea americana TaxID=3435 RepID=A0ACC2K7G1_PERAE|nr:hypothetical protein MRB53_013230 [Persea americana]
MVLWTRPTLFESAFTAPKASSIIGGSMLVASVLAGASWNLLVGPVSRKYPADLSLSTMMMFFGTTQAGIITLFLVTKSSWELKWEGGLVLTAILWGGIKVTGLPYYAHVWCVHKRDPVFAAAFQPLLIFFTFLLEATVLRETTHLGSAQYKKCQRENCTFIELLLIELLLPPSGGSFPPRVPAFFLTKEAPLSQIQFLVDAVFLLLAMERRKTNEHSSLFRGSRYSSTSPPRGDRWRSPSSHTSNKIKEWNMSNMRPIRTEVDIGRIGREIVGNVEDFVLIGIPFCRRKISIQAVKRGARASWGNFNATEINITSKGHFAFHFVSQADIDIVVTRGPWVFDGVLMGFQQVKGNQRYDDVEVSKLSFWVQLHSLPLNYFKEPVVQMIGEIIGDVQEIKFTDEDGYSLEDIVRLRIVMDQAVSLKDNGRWIHVKCEKLPYICRYCGRINHADEDCDLSFDLKNIRVDLKTWATVPIQVLPGSTSHLEIGCVLSDIKGEEITVVVATLDSIFFRRPEPTHR